MKRLRILLSVMLILSIFCSLTGCFVIPLYNNYQISSDSVSSIEVYDLRNNDSYFEEFLKTESPVYTIPKDQVDDFLNDLSLIRFCDTVFITIAAVDPGFYYGSWVVRVNYNDTSYRLISDDHYSTHFDKNDELISSNHYGCDAVEWKDLLAKYVPKDIFSYY